MKVVIQNYNSTKPQTWQVKFQNIQEGEYKVVATVTKPNGSYEKTATFNLKINRGYETTYFIIPYSTGLECMLATYYTLDQVYGRNAENNNSNDNNNAATERIESFNGKPVLNKKDFYDFWETAKKRTYSSDILAFLKKQIPNFYFYTDDVVYLVELFTYASDRLNLARFAYDYTLDK